MWGELALFWAGRGGLDDVREGLRSRGTPKAPGFPFSEVFGHAAFAGLSKQTPRLPRRARHDGDFGEFNVSVFGPVTSPKSLNQSNDFAPLFEPSLKKGAVHEVREKWICCDKEVGTRHEYVERALSKAPEELAEVVVVLRSQDSESRERTANAPIEGGGNAPNPSATISELDLLGFCILAKSVRGIRDDRMDGVRRPVGHPLETIAQHEAVASALGGHIRGSGLRELLHGSWRCAGNGG